MRDYLIAKTQPSVNANNIIKGNKYRITLLTPRLFRVQVSKTNKFFDYATQSVWFRDFGKVEFTEKIIGSLIIISTSAVRFTFNTSTLKAKTVHFFDTDKIEKCDNSQNLKGTRRTLDLTFGPVKLGNGIVSKNGVAIMEDGPSLTLDDKGLLSDKKNSDTDTYIFAYGNNYREAISALYDLCGKVPMIPRYALGNWWSRYRVYTQDEYTILMQKFIDKEVPISVATIDMDWHWTDLNKEFGTKFHNKRPHAEHPCTGGWTGYSWNKNLFPDHKKMLEWLHKNNMKTTLNLHPADGIRYFEDNYKKMAIAMGIDPSSKEPIPFEISKEKFIENYFEIIHTPLEKEGVDFWWMDWQQGTKSDLAGLDPLWALNHYHYLDNAKNGDLPLILSRYAGFGSHRYPLGFSGDTAINWKVLNFQPYFTSTATNAGYTWWSHDIGGHHFGKKDEQLYIRWLQYGSFSPIMRLHSTISDMLGKEPWQYSQLTEELTSDVLRFRHKLIPYLYTMDYRNHNENLALCEPMYYSYPNIEDCYKVPNEYMFGSELLVSPITSKISKITTFASTKAYIPNGRWTDIFTGEIYDKEGMQTLYRDLGSIPVLAKEGSIIPLSLDSGNSVTNPKNLELLIYRGNNSFDLYEDNGTNDFENNKAITTYQIEENDTIKFTINPATSNLNVIPNKRNYHLVFKDINNVNEYTIIKNDKEIEHIVNCGNNFSEKCFELDLEVNATDKILIEIKKYEVLYNITKKDWDIKVLTRWQTSSIRKIIIAKALQNNKNSLIAKLLMPKVIKRMLLLQHG
ncbi:MAG: TIM-barrel domain-containing protein [Clostridia bacterium]